MNVSAITRHINNHNLHPKIFKFCSKNYCFHREVEKSMKIRTANVSSTVNGNFEIPLFPCMGQKYDFSTKNRPKWKACL